MNTSTPHYDVFISSKSEDYPFAEEVYDFLISNGLSVFFADRELPRIGDDEYSEEIDKALDATDHMLVVFSKTEHLFSKWVKHEWSSFCNDLKDNLRNGNLLLLTSQNIIKNHKRDIPTSLRHHQALLLDDYQRSILNYLPSIAPIPAISTMADSWTKAEKCNPSGAFLMPVEDSFFLEEHGPVACGEVWRGSIGVNEKVEIIGKGGKCVGTTVGGIEMKRKLFDRCVAGDRAGVLLSNVKSMKLACGDFIVSPETISCHDSFVAEVYVLSKEEGGLLTAIEPDNVYDFCLGPCRTSCAVVQRIMAGTCMKIGVGLSESIPIEPGFKFVIQAFDKEVAYGIVMEISDEEISNEDLMEFSSNLPEDFLMPVENTLYVEDVGIVAIGICRRGRLKLFNRVDVVGAGNVSYTRVKTIAINGRTKRECKTGDNVALLLEENPDLKITRGYFIASPGTVENHKSFTARIRMFKREEGGGRYLKPDGRYDFLIGVKEFPGRTLWGRTCFIPEIGPGQIGRADIELNGYAAMLVGMRIEVRRKNHTIGIGEITVIND